MDALESIKKAASDANMYCIYVNTYFDRNGEFKDLDGTLSEVDADNLKANYQKGISSRRFTFNIHKPTDTSYDSFTWLIENENYYWAIDIEDADGEYEFLFKFFTQYFKNNLNDYLWFDDADWYYSAEDIICLSNQPYNPKWSYEKSVKKSNT